MGGNWGELWQLLNIEHDLFEWDLQASRFRHQYFSWAWSQATQTHVTREGCNVLTYKKWRAGVALETTVENIRDFVWGIYYWDLRTLNNAKPFSFKMKWIKRLTCNVFHCVLVSVCRSTGFLALLRNHKEITISFFLLKGRLCSWGF